MAITNSNNNASVNGSQDESEGEPKVPLPPIKHKQGNIKQSIYKKDAKKKLSNVHEKLSTLKSELSQQSFSNKYGSKKNINDDLKVDKARIFKKSVVEASKGGKKKKY